MIEKIKKTGIKREPGWLYFIDRDGDISKARMGKKRGKKVKEDEIPILPETNNEEERERQAIEQEVWEETLAKEKTKETEMIEVPELIDIKEEETSELRKKFGNLFENKFFFLIIGIGLGAITAYFITKSYYDKKIVEYQKIVETQQAQINDLLSLSTTGLSSPETSEQYIMRKYRETAITV